MPNIEAASPFLFVDPNDFVTPKMRDWLSNATIAHVTPLWLSLLVSRHGRYGGVEAVVLNYIEELNRLGIKRQIIFGHPGNKALEDPKIDVYTPSGLDGSEDLLNLLRTNKPEADELERRYILETYHRIEDNAQSISIVHDNTNFGQDQ